MATISQQMQTGSRQLSTGPSRNWKKNTQFIELSDFDTDFADCLQAFSQDFIDLEMEKYLFVCFVVKTVMIVNYVY